MMRPSSPSTPGNILEMEVLLQKDNNGSYRDRVLSSFEEAHHNLKQAMNRGLQPEAFTIHQQLLTAIDAAAQVIRRVWQHQHPEEFDHAHRHHQFH